MIKKFVVIGLAVAAIAILLIKDGYSGGCGHAGDNWFTLTVTRQRELPDSPTEGMAEISGQILFTQTSRETFFQGAQPIPVGSRVTIQGSWAIKRDTMSSAAIYENANFTQGTWAISLTASPAGGSYTTSVVTQPKSPQLWVTGSQSGSAVVQTSQPSSLGL